MEPRVLFEDDYLLAVDKPAGMVVNRGFGAVETVQDWIERYLKIQSTDAEFSARSGIVHRLDKETSGVLLIAKVPEVFRKLQRQFKRREVEKIYIALVHGRVEPQEGVIDKSVGRLPWKRTRFGVLENGRNAVTEYRTMLNGEEFSLLEVRPKTGRTHQIRVHMKAIGRPVVSDPLYAGRKTNRRDREWCPRMFLHASRLTFVHPVSGERVVVEVGLPDDLQHVLGNLGL